MVSSSYSFDVMDDCPERLQAWVAVATAGEKAVGWAVAPVPEEQHPGLAGPTQYQPRLVFYWLDPSNRGEGYQRLPAHADAPMLVALILAWLADGAEYGPQPHTDGSVTQGYRLLSTRFAYGVLAVEPVWCVYGK